jgi:hypothetical protein
MIKKKAAYRKILCNFLIRIKSLDVPKNATATAIGRYAAPVAYTLHNFVLASANDFIGFDEVAFWKILDD